MKDKEVSDTISVNTIKAYIKNRPLQPVEDARWYIWNTAGNFWYSSDTITLSNGVQTLSKRGHISIEKQTCKTISHEIVHRILLKEQNIQTCGKFDNIAENLKDYGVW